jgi:hypothetical protein
MQEIKISVDSKDFERAESFSKFREQCKNYLSSVGKNWDKFTIVSHDSFIGYITENAIKKYIESKFNGAKVVTWEEQFDLKLIIKIISEKKTDEASIELVRNYFYDSWDLMINGEKVRILSDVKTALTKKEPSLSWNFLYPVVQAEKAGKDIMILVYYVVSDLKDLHSFTKLVLVGAITPETIKKCKIIRAGEKTIFGTTSQIDNYITELNRDYYPLEKFI